MKNLNAEWLGLFISKLVGMNLRSVYLKKMMKITKTLLDFYKIKIVFISSLPQQYFVPIFEKLYLIFIPSERAEIWTRILFLPNLRAIVTFEQNPNRIRIPRGK